MCTINLEGRENVTIKYAMLYEHKLYLPHRPEETNKFMWNLNHNQYLNVYYEKGQDLSEVVVHNHFLTNGSRTLGRFSGNGFGRLVKRSVTLKTSTYLLTSMKNGKLYKDWL